VNSQGGQEHQAARLSLGAYVLGGLGPAQRGEVERHTATCPACQAELAGLAMLPALLRRIDPLAQTSTPGTPAGRRGGDGAAEPGSDHAALTRLVDQVRAERARQRKQTRRMRMTAAVAGVAAVATLAVTVGTAVVSQPPPASPAADIAMTPSDAGSSSGRAGLEARAWGTAVSLELQRLPAGTSFVAWAIADDGRREQAATWGSTPTGAARLSGATAIPRAQLARLEILTTTGESVLTAAA
jgi:anti-sigma factor RsiW